MQPPFAAADDSALSTAAQPGDDPQNEVFTRAATDPAQTAHTEQTVPAWQAATAEDTAALVTAAQAGDAAAVTRLLERFAPLVKAVARRYRRVAHADALQEGYAALLTCLRTYQPERGVPFAGYARRQVWGQVRSAMRKEWRCLARQYGPRGGTGDGTGLNGELWDRPHGQPHWPEAGGDAHGRGSGQASAGGSPDDGYAQAELRLWMAQAGLSAREQAGVEALLAGWTCAELAAAWGVGAETAKTWRKRGLRKLRHSLSAGNTGADE
ncbi:MAG: sigma-70 family RNA polymerase sigma factor [Alicyclobacillus sp.]|nr:sigma-70 family RNA polymerase sigma factor [Alicyclobacillus sp.]